MLNKCLKKHVTISMSNSGVLEGFISDLNDNYAELVETNNQIVLIKLDDISFVRLGSSSNLEQPKQRLSNFSMMTPSVEDDENSIYQQPTFIRKTRKDDID